MLGLIFLGGCSGSGEAPPTSETARAYLPDMDGLMTHFQRLYVARKFAILADTLKAANADLQASALHIHTAYAYWDAGMTDAAVEELHRAIDRGMSDPMVLEKFPKSATRLEGSQWEGLHRRLDSIGKKVGNLDHFEFRTDAMEAFWPYFEKAVADSSVARGHLKEFILKGPREIRDYYVVRYGSIDNMYGQMINGAPDYYQYLRKQFSSDSLEVFRKQVLEAMTRLKGYYKGAVFPKVFVVPGILNSGGTATEMGMFLGGDMYSRSGAMPVESLTDWQSQAIMDFSDLPRLTIHELMHFQQHYKDPEYEDTLLSAAIQEGVCDFLAELCLGEPLEHPNLDFMEDPANRDRIFEEFRSEMLLADTSKWLYNGGSMEDRPADLGYTMGYLITKSYFEQQQDKAAAVETLLTTDDFMAIVAGSQYDKILGAAQNQDL